MKRTITLIVLTLMTTSCSVRETTPTTSSTPTGPATALSLAATGIGDVKSGTTPEDAMVALTPVVGAPDGDTGWIDGTDGIYGRCPDEIRVIWWGSLSLFFGPAEGDGLFAYSYGFDYQTAEAGVDPRALALTTPDGVGVGTSVADLQRSSPDVVVAGDAAIDVWTFAIDPGATPHLRGQLSGPEPTDRVLFIETSTGCD